MGEIGRADRLPIAGLNLPSTPLRRNWRIASAFHGHPMWTINSNDVMQAKGRIERRRTEIETRYAEEKEALDAEFAVIETLERAASEFAVRHIREDHPGFVAAAPPPAEPIRPAPASRPRDNRPRNALISTPRRAGGGGRPARRRRGGRRLRHSQARFALALEPQQPAVEQRRRDNRQSSDHLVRDPRASRGYGSRRRRVRSRRFRSRRFRWRRNRSPDAPARRI